MTARPRVFVVNEPLRRDPETGELGRYFDLGPAEAHGDVVFLLPAGRVPLDTMSVSLALAEKLRDFGPDDYLLPVGDMTSCVMAASIVAVMTDGKYKVLRWIGRSGRYAPVEVAL